MTDDPAQMTDSQLNAFLSGSDPSGCVTESYDAKEAVDMEFELERQMRKAFVEPVYRQYANEKKLFSACESECRRHGKCCYLRKGRCKGDAIQPVGYNLRVRFMPLCIARTSDAGMMDWLRFCADHYLR